MTFHAGSNSAGQVMVIWQQELESGARTFARPFSMETGWGDVLAISNDFVPTGEQWVVLDQSGNAVAVWTQIDANNDRGVFASQYVAGVGWSKPANIEAKIDGDAHSLSVTIDMQGRVTAVWSVRRPSGTTQLVANTYE